MEGACHYTSIYFHIIFFYPYKKKLDFIFFILIFPSFSLFFKILYYVLYWVRISVPWILINGRTLVSLCLIVKPSFRLMNFITLNLIMAYHCFFWRRDTIGFLIFSRQLAHPSIDVPTLVGIGGGRGAVLLALHRIRC